MRKPLLIAHRGDTVNFPENTIEAFQSAFDLGADGIELDVHLRENGNLIVVHNYLYDRTKTYPALPEVLEKFSDKGRLEIEIKSFNPVCVEKVAELVKRYNPPDYELTSSILPLLPIIKNYLPFAKTGMIFRSNLLEEWMPEEVVLMFLTGYMNLTKSDILHLDLDKYTPSLISQLHKRNYSLHTHLKTGDKKIFNQVKELGIDQCTFDDINLLKLASE